MKPAHTFDLDVEGGPLRVGVWPGRSGAPTVLAAHGITANHVSFSLLADALAGDVTLVAPDLRGRGRSNRISGPFGIGAHAADLISVLDHAGVERATLVGHSMGGWVVACTAARYPERVASLVLVDGGIALPGAEGMPVDTVLDAVLGPAIARLSMTFTNVESHRDFWRQHPAVGGKYWSDAIEAYVDYDLEGDPPGCRSSVSLDAVRADVTEQLTVPEIRDVIEAVDCPMSLLFAPRGLLDGDPLYPEALRENLRDRRPNLVSEQVVAGTNHYTIVLGPGALAVAGAVRRAVGEDP